MTWKTNLTRINWPALKSMDDYFNELDRGFGNIKDYVSDWINAHVNIRMNSEQHYLVVEVLAPGVKKEEFEISYDSKTKILFVKTNNKFKTVKEYIQCEFNLGAFDRKISLKNYNIEATDERTISTGLENGILTICLPLQVPKPEVDSKIKISL